LCFCTRAFLRMLRSFGQPEISRQRRPSVTAPVLNNESIISI
jgi:hypothetical protein